MGTITYVGQTKAALSGVSGTLANGTYDDSAVFDCTTNDPWDVLIEVGPTGGTTSGNKKFDVFIVDSSDNSLFRSGPVSGTTVTDEPNLHPMGEVQLLTSSVKRVRTFSLRKSLGYIPKYFKVVCKNDSGAAITALDLNTQEIWQVY